jgi:hypothetical protein
LHALANTLDEDKIRRHILDCLGALISTEKLHSSKHKSNILYKAVIAICEGQMRRINECGYDTDDGVALFLKGNFSPSQSKSKIQLEAANGNWMPAIWACVIGGVGKEMMCELLQTESLLKAPVTSGVKSPVTAAHYAAAAYTPNFDAIQMISSPQSMRTRDVDGKVPLHWAAQYSRSLLTIEYLIRSDPSAIRISDYARRLPIEYLIRRKPFPEKLAMIKAVAEADPEAIAFSTIDADPRNFNVLTDLRLYLGSARTLPRDCCSTRSADFILRMPSFWLKS